MAEPKSEFPFAISFLLGQEYVLLFRSSHEAAMECAVEQATDPARSKITVWQATHIVVPVLAALTQPETSDHD